MPSLSPQPQMEVVLLFHQDNSQKKSFRSLAAIRDFLFWRTRESIVYQKSWEEDDTNNFWIQFVKQLLTILQIAIEFSYIFLRFSPGTVCFYPKYKKEETRTAIVAQVFFSHFKIQRQTFQSDYGCIF